MNSLIRNTVLLVASVTVFLVVLASLLWGWNLTATRYADHINELLIPSQVNIARAQRNLAQIQSALNAQSVSGAQERTIPLQFGIVAELDNLEHHLLRIVRLAHSFDYQDAFGIPARAHVQFEDARDVLLQAGELTPSRATRAMGLLEPLQHTLEQLEQIYELDERRWNEQQSQGTARALRLMLLALVLLVLTAVPFIARLSIGLRSGIRHELRARQDLEEAKQNLEKLALYDSLTDLGNRNLFKARLEQVVESTKRSHRVSALLYIDLDNFKRINDSLGHDAGDGVLKVTAVRLQECVRSTDTVARLGGDEFTVILTDVVSSGRVASIAANLLQQIRRPMKVAGTELVVSASMGITTMPADGDDPTILMKNADMALYKAKEHGRNNFQFFVDAMHRAVLGKMAMENDLRGAIRDEGFALHYQPQMNLVTGQVTCLEALLRWPRPDGTTVAPNDFIPLAEETGLLIEIGGWALMQACGDLARLREDGAPGLRVSVNLSAGQFRDPHLVHRIEKALAASALEPSALEVEITETTLIEDIDAAVRVLDKLRSMGITVAIDDFGIGYSSLNYLKHLPIDALKIDRSFVRDIEKDEADRSIVDAVIAIARSLSLRVVAEGVEDKGQLRYLAANGCDMGQGFLFSRPVPAGEISVAGLDRRWVPELAKDRRSGLHVV